MIKRNLMLLTMFSLSATAISSLAINSKNLMVTGVAVEEKHQVNNEDETQDIQKLVKINKDMNLIKEELIKFKASGKKLTPKNIASGINYLKLKIKQQIELSKNIEPSIFVSIEASIQQDMAAISSIIKKEIELNEKNINKDDLKDINNSLETIQKNKFAWFLLEDGKPISKLQLK